MKIWRLGGCENNMYVSDMSLYSMRSVILSQLRERKMGVGVIWHDV